MADASGFEINPSPVTQQLKPYFIARTPWLASVEAILNFLGWQNTGVWNFCYLSMPCKWVGTALGSL